MAAPAPRLSFLGAARSVTGSRFLLDTGRIAPPGGLRPQPGARHAGEELGALSRAADRIDEVLLTHAHLDHCGLLPRLVQGGLPRPHLCHGPDCGDRPDRDARFRPAAAEDAENKKRRHERESRTGPPSACAPVRGEGRGGGRGALFSVVRYGETVRLGGRGGGVLRGRSHPRLGLHPRAHAPRTALPHRAVLRRHRPLGPPDHQRPRPLRQRGLRAHGVHLRRPPPRR